MQSRARFLEFQLLTARLLEVQAHLPRKHHSAHLNDQNTDDYKENGVEIDCDTDNENDKEAAHVDIGHKDIGDFNMSDQDEDEAGGRTSTKSMDSRKLHKRNPAQERDEVIVNSFDGHSDAENAIHRPSFASYNINPIPYPSTDLSNMTFPSRMPSISQMQPSYDALVPQPYAPVFDDITITPCYDLVQESYAFSSTLQNANYLAAPEHEDENGLSTSDKRVLD
ncbi:hypothetical protein NUU61_006546 [Penicillium alfredii]|uniref:Uncharacterized protein n=1 Tax=Penicillium alfredii TaxID=1506179 RepID=A0A9W9F1B4_9EURO|nr:uncharacterized protein NUU61_006546 [Penicillium alfredii]KAJ5091676.1 hypothetical protein NUU61_006546 [Penicillium alfredii]